MRRREGSELAGHAVGANQVAAVGGEPGRGLGLWGEGLADGSLGSKEGAKVGGRAGGGASHLAAGTFKVFVIGHKRACAAGGGRNFLQKIRIIRNLPSARTPLKLHNELGNSAHRRCKLDPN